MQQVTCTAPGVYLIHEEGQRPVEGVAVYQYAKSTGAWVCQECGELMRVWYDCVHTSFSEEGGGL